MCQRKWAHDKIAKVPRGETGKGAALGSAVHAQLEAYLRDGRPFEFMNESGYIAQTAIEHLPPPMTLGLAVEEHFAFTSPGGHNFQGFIDWRHPHWPGDLPTVGDHKTTSSLSWAKTPEILRTDIQAMLYAYDTMAHYGVSDVRLQWTYMQTKGSLRSRAVVVDVHETEVNEAILEIDDIAAEMATILKVVAPGDVLSLPPTPSACEAFGGCPYQHLCNLSPIERMRNHAMANTAQTSSLLERLRARKLAVTVEEPHDTEPPPPINPPEQSPPVTVLDAEPNPADSFDFGYNNPVPKAKPRARKLPEEPVTDKPTDKPTVQEAVKALDRKIPMLFVDCMPIYGYGEIVLGAVLSENANRAICVARDVADYRYLEYGTGAGALLRMVLDTLDDTTGELPSVFLDSHTPEGAILLAGLAAKSACVIRGLK